MLIDDNYIDNPYVRDKKVRGINVKITFKINGELRTAEVNSKDRLLDFIREDLGLTGTKEGCGEGECGACTIIMDGKNVASCLVYAYQADGKEIYTIEGKRAIEELEIIQQAYVDAGAVQCGFCIPGMVMSTKVLLDKNLTPSREEIREGLQGNLCRCTGYVKIVDAVELAAERIRDGKGIKIDNIQIREMSLGSADANNYSKPYKECKRIDEIVESIIPKTINELLPEIDNEKVRITAGSTDIVVGLRNNKLTYKPCIDITEISELKNIFEKEDRIYIGGNVTLSEICESQLINKDFKVLVDAVKTIGSPQIRNRATLSGNVQNASPSGDGTLALILLNASLILRSMRGEREISVEDFILGVGKTDLKNDEFIEYILLNKDYNSYISYFEKVGLRGAMVISVASIGVLLKEENGIVQNIRIAFGAVAPKILRATAAEEFLKGKQLEEQVLADAGEIISQLVAPIDDLRASAEYRKAVCKNLILRLLELKKEGLKS
jgi:xanthine dehydrogenase small subunit